MLQRWRALGNTFSYLTGPRFEPQTYRSRDERIIPLDQLFIVIVNSHFVTLLFVTSCIHWRKRLKHVKVTLLGALEHELSLIGIKY